LYSARGWLLLLLLLLLLPSLVTRHLAAHSL
jgi:hypothetical protein